MKNLIRAWVLVPALVLGACGGGGDGGGGESDLAAAIESSRISLGDEFQVGYGETVEVGSLTLEFMAVEDSRCGANNSHVCFWAGNAAATIRVSNAQVTELVTLNTHPTYPTFAIFAGQLIQLHELDPQPRFTTSPQPDEYTATLSVEISAATAAP